jgi:fucose permease
MQFTLNSLRLIRLSEKRPDLAMGISALGAGSAIAVAPLLLGFLADQIGISKGYLMVPIIVLIAIVLVLVTPTKELD